VPETIATSLENLISETETSTVYFTLSGIKVAETLSGDNIPALNPGIYIERRGNTFRKIIIK